MSKVKGEKVGIQVNVDTEILDMFGNSIPMSDKEDAPKLQVKHAFINSLMGNYEDERQLSGEDKVKRFKIAEKVAAGGDVKLIAEEAAELKKVLPKMFNPLVVGRCYALLDA